MSNPTPEVEAIRAAVLREFPRAEDGGIYNRRKIAGTDKWSQHAYANAWDIFGPGRSSGASDQAFLDDVYRFLVRNRAALRIGELCWKDKGGCSAAAHQDHIHVSGPRMSGSPDNPRRSGVLPAIAAGIAGSILPGSAGAAHDAASGDSPLVPDAVERGADVLAFLSDPDAWKRIGMGAAGVALLVVAVALLARDLVPGAVGDAVASAAGA